MQELVGVALSSGMASGRIVVYEPWIDMRALSCQIEPIIIVAKDLTPRDTVQFGKLNVVAFVVEKGTDNSHVAILAKTMGRPAVTGIDIDTGWDGRFALVDGCVGNIIIDPDEQQRVFFFQKKESQSQQEILIKQCYVGRPTKTTSGKKVDLLANIASPSDIRSVLDNDAEGIGNFKTEFMLLDKERFPDEQEQFEIYRSIARAMGGRRVVIRTFDIGADKMPEYVNHVKEENPALGYRAIRIGLDYPNVFIPQIRAILRASAYGNVAVMYPFVISTDEIKTIKSIVRNIMEELKKQNIPFNEKIEQGIMIETPAAVIMSRELAGLVDFFSIGTNDLTQYTLAIDRNNPQLNRFNNIYHPAILRSIEYVVKNAHEANIWVSISGELGSDESMTELFINYGVDALTVSPNKILKLRKRICDL